MKKDDDYIPKKMLEMRPKGRAYIRMEDRDRGVMK